MVLCIELQLAEVFMSPEAAEHVLELGGGGHRSKRALDI